MNFVNFMELVEKVMEPSRLETENIVTVPGKRAHVTQIMIFLYRRF